MFESVNFQNVTHHFAYVLGGVPWTSSHSLGTLMSDPRMVVVMGTMDTKGAELAYLSQQVRRKGCRAVLMDLGVHNRSGIPADITADEVAASAGTDIEAIRAAPRGEAVEQMSVASAHYLSRMVEAGDLHGVIGMGGSGGTTICSAAMRGLPYGLPKIIVTTLASGNTRWHIGHSDIILMPSIVDIAGLNPFLEMVLSNAAGAITGMASSFLPYRPSGKKVVCLTMYGTTTPGVSRTVAEMKRAGYETWVFHASGAGGRSMERLIEEGYVAAVIDMTLAEIGAHLLGGLHDAGPERLTVAGRAGLPQVVVPGAVDTVVLPPRDQIPERFRGRTLNYHNPTMTTMRTTAGENVEIAKIMAAKLNASRGRVVVLLPKGGLSSIDRPGKIFYDPAANEALFETLKRELDPTIRVVESEHHIDDPEFAELAASWMQDLITDDH